MVQIFSSEEWSIWKNIRKSDDPKYKEVASEYSINQVFRQELEKQE